MQLIARARNLLKGPGLTFWLQVAVLSIAARSVEAAGWVETPPLILVVFLAVAMAAFIAGRTRRKGVYHLGAVLVGASLAYLGGVYLVEAERWFLKFNELHTRVARWWTAVVGEDVTTDILPLSVALIAITWLVTYITSWTLFRYRNVWFTLLPIGGGMMVNLTHLPERFSVYFFAFLFTGLLMVVHFASLERRSQLQAWGVPYPASIHRLSLFHGLWLSALVLGLAIAVPVYGSSFAPVKEAFRPMDRSVERFREELQRIFIAVPSHQPASIRFFGPVLPLLRPVPMSEETVFFAQTRYPLYWPAIAYDQYTSTAWKVENTEIKPLVPLEEEEEQGGTFSPATISYDVQLQVPSPYLLLPGIPLDVQPGAKQETPASSAFKVDLVNPQEGNRDLPPDIQNWASYISATQEEKGHLGPGHVLSGLIVTRVTKELPSSGGTSTIKLDPEPLSYYEDLKQALEGEGVITGI